MENKLPTQETSIESKRIEAREKVFHEIKENLNYIYIVIMIIANCLVSLLRINDDGYISFNLPKTPFDWMLWATQILLITFIGVMILSSFRRQGIKNGHNVIKPTYDEYLAVIASQKQDVNPRSLKEYLTSKMVRDTIFKGSLLVAVNILAISATISANLNALFALVINIILSIAFGIKELIDAEDYVITELIIWYKIEINKIKKKKERKK